MNQSLKIYKKIKFGGKVGFSAQTALIDTGADRSAIPRELAAEIGAIRTEQTTCLTGFHGEERKYPVGKVNIVFPNLSKKVEGVYVPVIAEGQKPIIGMDLLKPLGISIDTSTKSLKIKNEIWEAFKTLSTVGAIGVLMYGGIKVLDSTFEEQD